VPLEGEEIGEFVAQSVERGVNDRRPWYEPSEHVPEQRVIDVPPLRAFDTVVVEMSNARSAVQVEGSALVANRAWSENQTTGTKVG
jgi:hypothetical protein